MAIDKNPRQITRLRVEDQKKLEELATKVTYNSSTNTVEVGKNLSVNGTILTNYNNEALVIVDENNSSLTFSFEQGNALVIKNDNATGIYLDEFGDSGELYKVATSNSLKTVFGKSIMKDTDNPQDNNIGLYRHQLTLSSATNTYVGVIYLLNNTPITSTQLLTTYTKAFNGYMFLAVKVTGPADSQNAIGIGYTNNKWATTYSDEITNVSDTVKPI